MAATRARRAPLGRPCGKATNTYGPGHPYRTGLSCDFTTATVRVLYPHVHEVVRKRTKKKKVLSIVGIIRPDLLLAEVHYPCGLGTYKTLFGACLRYADKAIVVACSATHMLPICLLAVR